MSRYDEIKTKLDELSKAVQARKAHPEVNPSDKVDALAKQVADLSDKLAKAQEAQEQGATATIAFDNSPLRKGRFTYRPSAAQEAMNEVIKSGSPELPAEQVAELRKFNDDCIIMATVLGCHPTQLQMYQAFQKSEGVFKALRKGLNTGTANQGGNWVPTILSPDVSDKVRIATAFLGALIHQPMRSKNFDLPFNSSNLSATYVSEATANTLTDIVTGSTPTRGKLSLSAKTLVVTVWGSYEYDEDAVQDSLPNLRGDLIATIAEGVEDAALNGDPNGVRDSDVTATSPRNAWEGLRAKVIDAGIVGAGGTLTASHILSAKGKMGKYGVVPGNLVAVTGPIGLTKIMDLSQVQTLEKYGPKATILTGELGQVFGIPIIVSGQYREVLNSAGDVTGTGGTTTAVHILHRPSFRLGDRRDITLEMFRYPPGQQSALVASWRGDFGNLHDETADVLVSEIQNINN